MLSPSQSENSNRKQTMAKKQSLTVNERQARELIVKEVEKSLLAMKDHFEKIGISQQVTTVPIMLISTSIDIYIKTFRQAVLKP